jgi:nucleoside phosphorylase
MVCETAPVLRGREGTARVGILTIIPEEFDAVRSILGGASTVVEVRQTSYYSPDPSTCDVVLTDSIDRSNIPATHAASDMLEDFRPEVIVVCGIAGAFEGRDLDLGCVIVADYLHYCEFWKLTEGGDFQRYLPIEQPSPHLRGRHARPLARKFDLEDRVQVPRPALAKGQRWPPSVCEGSIVVGDKVMGNPMHYAQRLAASAFDNAQAVDMESVGVASTIMEERKRVDYNPRLVVIRGVSDIVRVADPSTPETKKQKKSAKQKNDEQRRLWKKYAASAAAVFCCAFVERLLNQPDLRGAVRTPRPSVD